MAVNLVDNKKINGLGQKGIEGPDVMAVMGSNLRIA